MARRVVRVLTAGTLIEDGFLAPGATARCVALLAEGDRVGLAAIDVSTGSCQLGVVPGAISSPRVGYQLAALETAELLLPVEADVPLGLPAQATVSRRPLSAFSSERGRALVKSAGAELPESADAEALALALAALAAVADYCQEGELAIDPAFLRLSWRVPGATMNLSLIHIRCV